MIMILLIKVIMILNVRYIIKIKNCIKKEKMILNWISDLKKELTYKKSNKIKRIRWKMVK
jgi:hypothetical protein